MNFGKQNHRIKVYELLVGLGNIVPHLKLVTKSLQQDHDELGCEIISDGKEQEFQWSWWYRLDPEDQHTVAFINALSPLDEALNSKDGARFLPRGVYRSLLEFSDKMDSWKAWAEWHCLNKFFHHNESPSEKTVQFVTIARTKRAAQQEIEKVVREIHLFENERREEEESFFGW